MNRIQKLFKEKEKGILSVYYTAGFPRLDDTVTIAKALEASGVDMIELGIPFSDPIADGPTIQKSNKLALQNGMTVKNLLGQLREIRKEVSIPIMLMGYLNPVLQYGVDKFLDEAAKAGGDGAILPDLPFDEFVSDYKAAFEKAGLSHTFLVSPTTTDARIRKIDELSTGFIYGVSASSTTGAKDDFTDEQVAYFKRLKGLKLEHPFLVGFGVSNKKTFSTAATWGAGAIVGSAFIAALLSGSNIREDTQRFVNSLKA